MSKKRRTYTREYKVEAVKLVTEQGISPSEAGRRLGIGCSMIFRLKQELEAEGDNAFPGYGNLLPVEEELSRFRAHIKGCLQYSPKILPYDRQTTIRQWHQRLCSWPSWWKAIRQKTAP